MDGTERVEFVIFIPGEVHLISPRGVRRDRGTLICVDVRQYPITDLPSHPHTWSVRILYMKYHISLPPRQELDHGTPMCRAKRAQNAAPFDAQNGS
jgi:hypothetical protein